MARALLTAFLLLPVAAPLAAQQPPAQPSADPAIVMLSDLHLDPLHDPSKVPLLDKAPVARWRAILRAPSSPDQEARFKQVQERCGAKDADASYALFRSSLEAAATHHAAFVMVSGDLLVHDLDCRYRAAMGMPASTTDDQSVSAAFAKKTTVFVMQQIEATFPRVPVYLALGNNDSRCNHNRLDLHDDYLKASSQAVIAGLRGVSAAERAAATRTYETAGYYAVTMPAPMRNTRLIVVDDLYMLPKYATCEADSNDHRGDQEQTAWLAQQLDEAAAAHQNVWVLGHLPPTVNPEGSLSEKGTKHQIVRFQRTEELSELMTAHADIVKLGIFGHTHTDEFHLLRTANGGIPIKVVGSVTPISSSLPSFTVGLVDTTSSTLADYSVYTASNRTGDGTQWTWEYSFNSTYGVNGFTPESLSGVIARMHADREATGSDNKSYREHALKGATKKKLPSNWPGYVCSLDNASATEFSRCVGQ